MDRESFIAAIIAELEEQTSHLPMQGDIALSSGLIRRSVNNSNEDLAVDVYNKMCFDYPLVSFEDGETKNYIAGLNHLTVEIRDKFIKKETSSNSPLRKIFNLNPAFIHNVKVYIPSILNSDAAQSRSTAADDIRTAIYCLCNTLFLQLPEVLLCQYDLKSLSKVLSTDMTTIYGGIGSQPASDFMSWNEVGEYFKLFVSESSASAVLHEYSLGHVSRQNEFKGLDSIFSCITILSGLLFTATSQHKSHDSSTVMTLKQYLQQALRVKDDITATTSSTAFDTVRSCWLHLSLLCRDIFLRRPDLLKATSANPPLTSSATTLSSHLKLPLTKLGEALLLRSIDTQPARGDHPSSGESLFISVLASLCSSFSDVGKDSAQSNELATGRAAMIHYFRFGNTHMLRWFVDCCVRAMQHAPLDATDFPIDPSNCLLDVVSLLLSDDAMSAESLGEILLGPSRLWATLLQILQEMVARDAAALGAYHTSSSTPLPTVSQSLAGCTKRIVRAVSIACYRSGSVAMFTLRYPNLMSGIRLLLVPGCCPTNYSSLAVQLARTLQHTRSGLLLQPHYMLCVAVATYSGCCSARPAESYSEEEKDMLFQLVRFCSLTIGQELSLYVDLISQAAPVVPVATNEDSSNMNNRRPLQRDARLKIAPQLQQLADCATWISRKELRSSDQRLQQLLRDLCSECLAAATKIVSAATVVEPEPTATVLDALGTQGPRAEEDRDHSSVAAGKDDEAEGEADILGPIDAAVQNLRKKLKGLQYFLDANISSNKND